MNIGLLNIMKTYSWDFRRDQAQNYANALKNAVELHVPNDKDKHQGYFLSRKGCADVRGNFEDKLYVGNIHYIERHLYWNDEELADDDQIVNVVVIDGPVTRDGGGCSYGTKDFRDQVEYANSIPQVIGHVFLVNTPGGESACRKDYDEIFRSCRESNKPTVWFVDGMCCSSGVNGGCRADRVIVRNPKDDFGCIGSMAAFWATPDGAIDRDGTRYVEIVGDESPEKNDWYREAAQGNYEKLREMINKDTEEFHQTVRENRPLVEDWMLKGGVFNAQELIPALVDEIGDFNRALECVFELADGRLQSARGATVVKDPEEQPGEQPGNGEPEEMAKPQNSDNMTEEEKKAQEAAAAQAAQEQEPNAEGQQATQEQPAAGVQSDGDSDGEGVSDGAGDSDGEGNGAGGETTGDGNGAGEGAGESDGAGETTGDGNGAGDMAKMQDALHNSDASIAERDKTIAELKEALATLNGIAGERNEATSKVKALESQLEENVKSMTEANAKIAEHIATIETLQKQVANLRAEVKELSGQPAPMVDASSGIPADNGTGDAPKTRQKRITRENMTYKHCREVAKGK